MYYSWIYDPELTRCVESPWSTLVHDTLPLLYGYSSVAVYVHYTASGVPVPHHHVVVWWYSWSCPSRGHVHSDMMRYHTGYHICHSTMVPLLLHYCKSKGTPIVHPTAYVCYAQ